MRTLPSLALLAAALAAAPHALRAQDVDAAPARRDSANALLRGQIRAALADAGVADPHGLLLVEGLRESGELQIRLLQGDVPDSALLRAYQRLHDRPGTWPGDTLRSLVRVDEDAYTGPVPTSPENGPEAENLDELARRVDAFRQAHPALTAAGQAYTAWVEVVVTRGGEVAFSMVRGPSGNAQVDAFAAQAAAGLRFRPMHAADTPVDGWLTLPITVGPPGTPAGTPAVGPGPANLAGRAQAGDTSALRALHGSGHAYMSMALRRELSARGITGADALLLVSRTQRGQPAQVRVLEGAIPPGVLAALDTVIQAQVARWPDACSLDYIRAFEPLDEDVPGGAHEPTLVNRGQIGASLGNYLQTHQDIGRPGEQINLRVKMLVSRTGAIPYVEIDRSSGNVHVDQSIMNIVRRMRVQPARVGDRAVDTWIMLPVTMQLPDRPAEPTAPGQTPIRGDRTPKMGDGVRP